jgi:alkylation response protein AidB-like acyl-CoA dehydrogenase
MHKPSYEEELIRDSARRLFAADYDLGFIRSLNEEPEKQGRKLLALIQEMGWQSLIVPEEHGGVGYGFNELCGLLQEHGYAAMPPLFFANHVAPVLCLNALSASGKTSVLLESISEGQCIPCVAADSATLQSFSNARSIQAEKTDGGYALTGTVSHLVSAGFATVFFVPARIRDRTLFITVDAGDTSLELTPHRDKSFGQSHDLAFNNTLAGEDSLISEDAGAALSKAFRMCAIAKSAEMIGGAERAMQFAVEHISTRKQFGKLLAEFQAVQHQAADMFKSIEVAKLFLHEAAELIDAAEPFEMAAHNCKAWSNQANFQATKTSHQLMGGTGYMMETDLHLLTLQGLRNEYEFGSTDHHKDAIAGLLGM